jgi:hypothetical protein
MTHIFNIQNDTVLIDKLAVSEINSNVSINGNTITHGSVNIYGDLQSRNITANTLRVKELISETTDFGNWYAKTFSELNGKGITWTCEEGATQLIYRTGNRIWTSSNIDISVESSYLIDNTAVLSLTSLGPTVTKSNLRQVGALTALSVIGSAAIGGFAYFDENTNRLGLGTTDPSASISIIDNNVEISIGSPANNIASIGTNSNHDFSIITDNIDRILIKHSGDVEIGNQFNKSAVLRVFGSLHADSVVSDIRVERTSSLMFNETTTEGIYNKGLQWNNVNNTSSHLLLKSDPCRLWSSESIDVSADKSYFINGIEVISETKLGDSVVTSKLESVGNLKELTVAGDTTLSGNVTVGKLLIDSIETSKLVAVTAVSMSVDDNAVLYASNSEIVIGSLQNTRRPVKVFGPVSIGINNPDPSVSFSVSGAVSFNNKKFIVGDGVPAAGEYTTGDIIWSKNPINDGYVGWVCIRSGTPGEWKPFGALGV